MKNFISAIFFCFFLIIFGVIFLLPKSEAQNNVLQNLVDLPAPPPPNPLMERSLLRRRRDMYLRKEPPTDDSPIEELLAYWEIFGQGDTDRTYVPKPSERSLEKIIEAIEKNPEILTKYLSTLSREQKHSDFVKRLYDIEVAERKQSREWREIVKDWLQNHSSYQTDGLYQLAKDVKDTDEYLTNQESLIALAKVDWEKARPIVERLLNDSSQPISRTLARWVAYQHAISEGNSIEADRYRKALQETVENKNEKPGNRDLAMDAIVRSGDFPGRDDWYYSLLSDETLYDLKVNGTTYTGLTTLLNMSPPDKYAAKMIELVGSNNQTIRNAAAKNLALLINNGNPEVVRALLPWLENPKWAIETGGERLRIVQQLTALEIPESVPGLLFVLNEKETRQEVVYNENANTAVKDVPRVAANTSGTQKTAQVEYFPFRSSGILALSMQKDMRAVPALRNLLPEVNQYERTSIVRAILECKGFSIPEQVQALEAFAKNVAKADNQLNANVAAANAAAKMDSGVVITGVTAANRVSEAYASNVISTFSQAYNPAEIPIMLGSQLTENREVSEELLTAVIERIKTLEKTSPKIATAMRNIIKNWRGKGVNSLMLKDLKSGTTDVNSIIKLLTLRKKLREEQNNEIYDIRSGNSIALGISACLLEDDNEYNALLESTNDEAKIAMLSCAKLLRANLPIQKVAENLKSPNKMLATAAERFLETEDSPQSRQIILSLHPNEAKILGAKTAFFFTDYNADTYELNALFTSLVDDTNINEYSNPYLTNHDELDEIEKKLQKEVKDNSELVGIYAYDDYFIRIFKDKAVFSWEEDSARYRERTLTKEEFSNLTSYLSYNRVDELAPFNSLCDYCEGKELLMLGKQGGRRVFVNSEQKPKFFVELDEIFVNMKKQPAKLHYWLEKHIAGLEVLFENENLEAKTVWKNGNDVKLLVEDSTRRKQIEKELELQESEELNKIPDDATDEYFQKQEDAKFKRRKQREFEEFSWHKFANDRLGEIIAQPAEVEYIPAKDNTEGQWKARNATVEIRTDGSAIYKISRGITTKIKSGNYYNPVISSNGNWLVVTKEVEYEQTLVRINLLTNKEFKLKLPELGLPNIQAEVFIPAVNKMLIFSGYSYRSEEEYESDERNIQTEKDGSYYLLDTETGVFQEVKGEIKPLTQQTFRVLQPTTNPNEFWAALRKDKATEIGRYDSKLLKFRTLIKLPEIEFDSMSMYVDEKEAKIYIVYEGQLIRIPMPK